MTVPRSGDAKLPRAENSTHAMAALSGAARRVTALGLASLDEQIVLGLLAKLTDTAFDEGYIHGLADADERPRPVPARLSGQERAVAESDEPTPYDASFGRLSDIIDEAFGMQPVMTDAEILTFLEQSLAKQRRESPDHLAEARLAIRRAFDCNTPASMFEALSDALTHINAAALSSSTDTETKR